MTAFIRAYPPSQPPFGPAIWLPFLKGELLVHGVAGKTRLHQGNRNTVDELNLGEPIYLGTLAGVPCLTADADPGTEISEDWAALSLRALFGQVSDAEYAIAGYASQMLYWRRTSGFCPVCGHRTEPKEGDWGRCCPECGHVAYPHVTPATLILIHDGSRLLLAQKPGWGTRYSILAGFVEPNESLEDCVRRETREEVGLEITDLAYAGSQPWPYPHQLMVGFTARYVGGDIEIDTEELERAGWFELDALPDLPPPVSLSRQMIDSWLAGQARE
jgi:NAD+ diphosphatase